jgi:TPR repeat protein
MLAQFYHLGIGCTVDLSKAMAIYQNYPDNIAAQLSRGLLLKSKNPALAYRDFERVASFVPTEFDKTHWRVSVIQQEAAVQMAVWELQGLGQVPRNPTKSFTTLKKLSEEQNYSGAHYWLGCAYVEGIKQLDGTWLIKPDTSQAFCCFLRGEQKGECQYLAGKILKEGFQHGEYSKKDAFGFFLKAAELGYYPAYTQVGVYYYSGGVGTDGQDKNRAFQYFAAAAKFNDTLAIQYLADYIIHDNAHGVDTQHVYEQLSYAAGVENDVVVYRMLALVVHHSGVDLCRTYEGGNQALLPLYQQAKQEAMSTNQDIRFRFALHCLWKAIELNDYGAGQYLNQFYPSMTRDDQIKTIELFQKIESGVPNK